VAAASAAGGCHPVRRGLAYLTSRVRRRTVRGSTTRRSITLDAEQFEARHDELERLRAEVADLRASRARLILAADADRRAIERDLHDGVHQHLVALATSLQLARLAADADPATAKMLLEELSRDVRQALDETALLVQRIYPSTLELGGLAALLRSAARNAGIPATIDVSAGSSYSPKIVMTIYLCWLALLARGSNEGKVAIRVREDEDAVTFELVGNAAASDADLDRLQDRVEALGGRLTSEPEPGGIRVSGCLPSGG
jgi:signal transduction histidine kinase